MSVRRWDKPHCICDGPGCTWDVDLVEVRRIPVGPIYKCVACLVQELVWCFDPSDNGGDPLGEFR